MVRFLIEIVVERRLAAGGGRLAAAGSGNLGIPPYDLWRVSYVHKYSPAVSPGKRYPIKRCLNFIQSTFTFNLLASRNKLYYRLLFLWLPCFPLPRFSCKRRAPTYCRRSGSSVLQLNLNNIFSHKKYNRITRVGKMKSIIISILSNTRMAAILHNLIKYKSGGRYRSICNRIRESKRVCVKWNKWVDIFDGKNKIGRSIGTCRGGERHLSKSCLLLWTNYPTSSQGHLTLSPLA